MSKDQSPLFGYNYDDYPYEPDEPDDELTECKTCHQKYWSEEAYKHQYGECVMENQSGLASCEVKQICPEIYYGYEVCDRKDAESQICQQCQTQFSNERDVCPECGCDLNENIRIQLEMKRLDGLMRIGTESFQNAMNLMYYYAYMN